MIHSSSSPPLPSASGNLIFVSSENNEGNTSYNPLINLL